MSADISSLQLNYRITNSSSKELLVKIKGGLSYIIRRSTEATFRDERLLYIKMENVHLDNLLIEEDRALTKLDTRILKELKAEQMRLKESHNTYYKNMTTNIGIMFELTSALVERNDAIHSELLGITMYANGERLNAPSLNTPDFTLQQLVDTHNEAAGDQKGLGYFIYVNDPDGVTNPFYANVLGKATEVPVDRNRNEKPGLYVGILSSNQSLQKQYYIFDSLDEKTLEQLGLFKTKADCEKGGNTERFLSAENKVKELNKEVGILRNNNEDLTEQLGKVELAKSQLIAESTKAADTHRTELTRLKYEHNQEMSQLKHQSKMSSEMFKYETRVKDTVNKANVELVKQKGAHNSWGDFAKAVGTLAGVAFTGYQLLSS